MDTVQAVVTVVLALLFRPFIKPVIYSFTKLTRTEIDDKIIESIANPLWFVVVIFAADYLIREYLRSFEYVGYLHDLNYTIIVVLFAVIAKRLVDILIFDVFARSRIESIDERHKNTALIVLANLSATVIYTIAVLYALSIWGVDVGPLLASAGIMGLVIGLALKDPLENTFYGIILAIDPHFRVGDAVELEGVSGVVEEISLRNTKIRTWDGNLVIMPNSLVANAKITNYEFPDERVRTGIVIGVSYDADPDEVKETLLEIAESNPHVLDDPEPTVLFTEMGDFALSFKLLYWTKRADRWTTLDEINTAIIKTFRERGIEIPYPIQTVYLRRESEGQ